MNTYIFNVSEFSACRFRLFHNRTAPLHNLGIDSIADLMRPELEAIILKAGVTPDKLATLRAAASGATNTANL